MCDHDHDEENEVSDAVTESLKKCPLCSSDLAETDMLHPVMVSLGGGSAVMVFLHESCVRQAHPKQMDAAVLARKYDIMLVSVAENEISKC